MANKILRIYKVLSEHFGPQNWWPTSWKNKKDEIIIGAVLTQNTSWQNVKKALLNLKEAKITSLARIISTPIRKLTPLIRPAGYYNQKAKKLKIVTNFFQKHPRFTSWKLQKQRKTLLELWGIGEETADSILLYAFNQPIFVVDAYTKRIFSRLGISKDENIPTQIIKQMVGEAFEHFSPLEKTRVFQEFHALLVELGKSYCLKTKPRCAQCPFARTCQRNLKN